jgi:hypothetical protein
MTLGDLQSRTAVLQAVDEYDRLGQQRFLDRYGFGPARRYFLIYDDRSYDSKAIVAAAHGYESPERGPLRSAEFNGGQTVQRKLESLGFEVKVLPA